MIDEDRLIVVTGGAGFIGSHVVATLNSWGFSNILIVDFLGTSLKWKNLVGLKFYDIIDKDDFFDWLDLHESDVQAYLHLGACCVTTESDASYLLENNYHFTIALAERAIANDQRFIYASSAATYGDALEGFDDDHEQLDSLKPLNMYAYSKHLVDLWIKNNDLLDQVVGLKYFNVFGPKESHKGSMASPIKKMVQDINSKQTVSLFKSMVPEEFANGEQSRDFIYVKDAARMTCAFLYNEVGGIYNIGRGEAVTWNTLAQAVIDEVNPSARIEYIPTPDSLKQQYQNYTCASMKKFNSLWEKDKLPEKCWREPYSIQDAVSDYLSEESF